MFRKRINLGCALSTVLCAIGLNAVAQQTSVSKDFKKTKISGDFISEGVAVADLNKDGKPDIIAGYYWFEAPSWKKHEMAPSQVFDPQKEYSNSFLNLGMDVNQDGWEDVVIVDFPGKPGFWFENPQNKPGEWRKHIIADSVGIGNESPNFVDIDGDGRLEILCADVAKKQIVWLQAPVKKGETKWSRFAMSKENVPGTERFSHGIGYGDLNKDGIKDVLITDGWFQGKADAKSGDWEFHPTNLGESCSHMHVMDLNGDGKNDVISASAHALGVWWHEQVVDTKGRMQFASHLMSKTTSQTHASIMADLNGDGNVEMVTGKRYLAHHGHDPGDSDPPILMYFELTPGKAPYWKEHVIDHDSGSGLNIVVQDVNGDKKPDIVTANKYGVFLFENNLK
jgi:hypothetical protein